jgi:hypothetical protein
MWMAWSIGRLGPRAANNNISRVAKRSRRTGAQAEWTAADEVPHENGAHAESQRHRRRICGSFASAGQTRSTSTVLQQ